MWAGWVSWTPYHQSTVILLNLQTLLYSDLYRCRLKHVYHRCLYQNLQRVVPQSNTFWIDISYIPGSYKLALFHVLQSRLLFVTYGKTCLFLQNGRQINSSNICALTLVVTPVFIHFETTCMWLCGSVKWQYQFISLFEQQESGRYFTSVEVWICISSCKIYRISVQMVCFSS